MIVKLTIDREAGAAYAKLTDEPVARTEVGEGDAEGVNVDIDAHGRACGIEFLTIELVESTPNPLDYECPVCDALAGKYCSVPGSRGRRQVPWVHPVREAIAQAHALGADNDENGESNATV